MGQSLQERQTSAGRRAGKDPSGTLHSARKALPAPAILNAIVGASPLPIVSVDFQGNVTSWNAAAEKMFGWTAAEVLGKLYPLAPLPQLREVEDVMQRVRNGETVTDREVRRYRRDGTPVDVSYSAAPLYDGSGECIGLVAMLMDITERKRTEQALRDSEERFRATFDQVAVGIAHTDLDGHWLLINQRLVDLYGYSREELRTLRFQDITHPDDLELDLIQFERLRAGEIASYSMEKRYIRKDGSLIWAGLTVSMVRNRDGSHKYVIAFVEDISDRKRAEERIRQGEARFRTVFESTAIGMSLADGQGRFIEINPALERMTGYSAAELRGRRFDDITFAEDADADLQCFNELLAGRIDRYQLEKRYVRKDGSPIWVRLTVSLLPPSVQAENSQVASGGRLSLGMVEDITERKEYEDQLRHQALHDPLTGLPNRVLLRDRLEQALREAVRQGRTVALFLLDLNRFKEVNDTFGHQFGDELLEQLGPRFKRSLRAADTVARLGGDEFAVILPGISPGASGRAAERILRSLETPFTVNGQILDIDASIGVALYPEHGTNADTLLRHADVAMYAAKQENTGYFIYASDRDPNSQRRLALARELRRAVETDQLYLQFHPKIDLKTGRVIGVEALTRWQHPEYGLVSPDEFIPLAEQTGLIKPLTCWVLQEALKQRRRWEVEAGLDVRMAVNLSMRSFHDEQLVQTIAQALDTWETAPCRLEVEVTETAFMADPARALTTLETLHNMGVSLSIDDFGTGYSSLAYLRRLPAAEVKIDRSFVMDMVSDENACSIVRATIGLAHDLDLKAVAEGVETCEVWDLLGRLGCDLAQGFYLSRPMSTDDCMRWLLAHGRATGECSVA